MPEHVLRTHAERYFFAMKLHGINSNRGANRKDELL